MFMSFIYRGNTQLLVSDLLMVGGQTSNRHTHTHTHTQTYTTKRVSLLLRNTCMYNAILYLAYTLTNLL